MGYERNGNEMLEDPGKDLEKPLGKNHKRIFKNHEEGRIQTGFTHKRNQRYLFSPVRLSLCSSTRNNSNNNNNNNNNNKNE